MIGSGKPQSEILEADKSVESRQEVRAGERLVSSPVVTESCEVKDIDYKKVN